MYWPGYTIDNVHTNQTTDYSCHRNEVITTTTNFYTISNLIKLIPTCFKEMIFSRNNQ
ncbi:hypothetical protein KSF78_0000880 [Schistosoma japonicum]|uniref:Uncharacterized protein n=1 Tax=Schistosoma japonicum TaxID=6182 RepID=C7TSC9_SCHJA|nr:hypothetical protein KSF78_0000880 [Schistosoma japonicum]CAX72634.1 hypothetical protein [Schistosoma japonicum]CAX74034.1 hypothetical protein [Schistosoma japonicum]CAX74310.1 hypothetical protein [Schistosoma japonicum]CAX74311.1 hypothetical protein [Schistosoma japonicum]